MEGVKGSEKIKRQYKLYKDIKVIFTKQDPKCYPDKAIQEMIYRGNI